MIYGGSWHVENGRWYAPIGAGTAGVKAVATGTDFADFTYDADVTPASSGDTGLIFRVSRPSLGDNAFDGYYVGVSPSDGQIVRRQNQRLRQLLDPTGQAGLATKAGMPIHIRVIAEGSRIRVFAATWPSRSSIYLTKVLPMDRSVFERYATAATSVPAGFTNLSVVSRQSPQP